MFATYEDVAVLLGRALNAAEQAAATAALIEAESAVGVYTRKTFVEPVPPAIKGIVVRAAVRALTNLSTGGSVEAVTPDNSSAIFGLSDLALLDKYAQAPPSTITLSP